VALFLALPQKLAMANSPQQTQSWLIDKREDSHNQCEAGSSASHLWIQKMLEYRSPPPTVSCQSAVLQTAYVNILVIKNQPFLVAFD